MIRFVIDEECGEISLVIFRSPGWHIFLKVIEKSLKITEDQHVIIDDCVEIHSTQSGNGELGIYINNNEVCTGIMMDDVQRDLEEISTMLTHGDLSEVFTPEMIFKARRKLEIFIDQ